jgi:hypothetical protein
MLNGGGGDQGKNLVHLLHETARMLQSAMEEQSTLTRGPWFAQKWLGIDKNAWLKSLAYQANSFHRILLNPCNSCIFCSNKLWRFGHDSLLNCVWT